MGTAVVHVNFEVVDNDEKARRDLKSIERKRSIMRCWLLDYGAFAAMNIGVFVAYKGIEK